MIAELKPSEVFVFGANADGHHGAGAARTALEKFGAVYGQGEGLQGQSYGIVTMSGWAEFSGSAQRFNEFARSSPDLTFLLTKVGCGIAGYDESQVKRLFEGSPPNVKKPEGWDE